MINFKWILAILPVVLCANVSEGHDFAQVTSEYDGMGLSVVEEVPQFPGGESALMKFIDENKKYPARAFEKGIEGRVIVQFVVTSTGKVGEAKVCRGVDIDLDEEALRVVGLLPDFVPGKMNGKAVNIWYTLPVIFKLPEMPVKE